MPRLREKRWIALGSDGRHVTLGRHSNPTDAEIGEVETKLVQQGLGGWLAVAEGDYWNPKQRMTLLMVRRLGAPAGEWEHAVSAFNERRQTSLQAA